MRAGGRASSRRCPPGRHSEAHRQDDTTIGGHLGTSKTGAAVPGNLKARRKLRPSCRSATTSSAWQPQGRRALVRDDPDRVHGGDRGPLFPARLGGVTPLASATGPTSANVAGSRPAPPRRRRWRFDSKNLIQGSSRASGMSSRSDHEPAHQDPWSPATPTATWFLPMSVTASSGLPAGLPCSVRW